MKTLITLLAIILFVGCGKDNPVEPIPKPPNLYVAEFKNFTRVLNISDIDSISFDVNIQNNGGRIIKPLKMITDLEVSVIEIDPFIRYFETFSDTLFISEIGWSAVTVTGDMYRVGKYYYPPPGRFDLFDESFINIRFE